MSLQLDGDGNISTTIGDTSTYTWEDIVALNSSKLDVYGTTRPFYRWRGLIEIGSTAILNIEEQNIELYGISNTEPGIIRAIDHGTINFGKKQIVNTKTEITKGCNVTITRLFSDTSGDRVTYSPLSFNNNDRFNTTGKLNLYNTRVFYNSINLITDPNPFAFICIFVSYSENCIIQSQSKDSGSALNTIYFQTNGTITNIQSINVTIELLGTTTINSIKTTTPYAGLVGYISPFFNIPIQLSVNEFTAINPTVFYFVDQGTGITFINSPDVNLALGRINGIGENYFKEENKKAYTHNLQIIDNNGNVSNALVIYEGRSSINELSVNGLVPTIQLITEETIFASLPFPESYVYPIPLPTVDYSSYTRQIKSYLHLNKTETLVVNNKLGDIEVPAQISLTLDTAITQSNSTTVLAYTGITHTTSTITITELRTLDEIYDSRKLYWRNNINVDAPYLEGNILNLNGANLIVDGINLVSSSKFRNITTTGTITYLNNGNTSFPTKDLNGFRFKIYGLPTKPNSYPVIRIKRISNNTITNPIITNGEVYIYLEEGEDYEVRADAVGFIASNFITINTNISSELEVVLQELLDANNNPVYGNGIQQQKDLITYDNATNTISIAYDSNYPTIDIFSAVDKLEEILATNTGLEIAQHPVYINGKLVFTRNIVTNAQSTIKIKPLITNTGDPELLFELVREGDEKPYNLFDFTNSNGRVIRYPTTVNVAQFDGEVSVDNTAVATAVWTNNTRTLTSSASLTPEQEAKLNNLDVAVSTRLSSNSYLQAPTTAQIRTEIESSTVLAKEATIASRASQTSVDLIPTNTVLTTDNRLNNLDVAVSTRLAITDYNEAPTVADIRTELSTELSRIDVTVSSRATSANVWTNSTRSLTEGVIVTTNNDKTNYELSSNSINAIWNTLLSSLTTIGSIGKRIVDFLDTTISSRSSQSSVDTKPTLTNIESSTVLAKQTTLLTIPTNPVLDNDTRLNTLDANISTRLASSNYLAPLTSNETNTIITNTLNTKDVVTNTNLNNTKTELLNAITLTGLTEEQDNKLTEISTNVLKLKKLRGLVSGVSVIAKAPTDTNLGYLRTSDNDINLVITKNGEEEILSD